MKTLIFAFVTFAFTMPAMAAEYYVVQEKTTKKCKVVETRPTEETWVVVGDAAFKTETEAQERVKVVCKEKMEH